MIIMISTDQIYLDTLWLFNIAMENGPFIDGLPIENGDFPWQTVTNIQMVYIPQIVMIQTLYIYRW